jgi:hypothetical protein
LNLVDLYKEKVYIANYPWVFLKVSEDLDTSYFAYPYRGKIIIARMSKNNPEFCYFPCERYSSLEMNNKPAIGIDPTYREGTIMGHVSHTKPENFIDHLKFINNIFHHSDWRYDNEPY